MSLHPHVRARRVVLRPAVADDSLTFYRILLRVGIESLPPPPDAFRRQFFEDPDAAFRIHRADSDEIVGFATLRALSQAGHMRIAVYVETDKAKNGVAGEALFLVVNYAFAAFNIDTLVCRTTEASFADLRIGGEDGQVSVAVFPGHRYFRGRLLDLHHFLVVREEWAGYWKDIEEYIVGPVRSRAGADRT